MDIITQKAGIAKVFLHPGPWFEFRSALLYQAYVELHGSGHAVQANALVVAVDGFPLRLCQVRGGKAVHLVGDCRVVAAVGALHHKVGRNERALPGTAYCLADTFPALAVRAGYAAGLRFHGGLHLYLRVLYKAPVVLRYALGAVRGVDAHVGGHGR